jgi:hypothetical protein
MGYIQAVGTVTKKPLPKRALIIPLTVKDHERVGSARQDVHVILGIHGHPGALEKFQLLGELAPPIDILIPKIANSIYFTHNLPPFIRDKGGKSSLS